MKFDQKRETIARTTTATTNQLKIKLHLNDINKHNGVYRYISVEGGGKNKEKKITTIYKKSEKQQLKTFSLT